MSRALKDALFKLHQSNGSVRASSFTKAQAAAVDEFARRTGAVRRVAAGAGAAYRIERPQALVLELERLYPGAIHEVRTDLPARAQNLARTRSTKTGTHRHGQAFLLLRAIGDECRWHSARGEFDVSAQCRLTGITALEIDPENDWTTDQPLWLVENQALFAQLDWLPAGATGTVGYFAGNLSDLQLQWLGARQRARELIFFGDYDGTGLDNYARLLAAVPHPVRFWIIPNWPELLTRYGSTAVWADNREKADRALARLQQYPLDAEMKSLLEALWREGAALEHEAVWL